MQPRNPNGAVVAYRNVDGTIDAEDAIRRSATILQDQLGAFVNLDQTAAAHEEEAANDRAAYVDAATAS